MQWTITPALEQMDMSFKPSWPLSSVKSWEDVLISMLDSQSVAVWVPLTAAWKVTLCGGQEDVRNPRMPKKVFSFLMTDGECS